MTVKHRVGSRPCNDPTCWCQISDTNSGTLAVQVDGDHYKNLNIQPAVYSYENFGPAWHQGEIIKYVTRYRNKNGLKDLEKAKHLIEMLMELEYDVR